MASDTDKAAGDARRLFVYNGGFLTQRRVRRILELSGYQIKLGAPSDGDMVGVWGQSPTSGRGEKVAEARDAPVLRVEDAFLRSVLPGREGSDPIGLHLDTRGVHFDPAVPSDLEHLLATHPLDDTALLDRARDAIERIQHAHLSKYNAFEPQAEAPAPGYVLVIDQTRGDASVTASGADQATFQDMLICAMTEFPGSKVLVKTHPETVLGHREGYFSDKIEDGRVQLFSDPVSPWVLFEGAVAVYTVSSQMGFEAIFAGHKPRVFGQPFYAGWGLTDDRTPVARRERRLTRAQLFAAAMILYPVWYDPHRDALCELEQAIDALEADARAWRDDHLGWVGVGMRLWKRRALQKVFGKQRRMLFDDDLGRAMENADGRRVMVWAGKAPDIAPGIARVEDGFLRSRGLGAELVPPLSLAVDDLGIYYDPTQPSRLEALIGASAELAEAEHRRAAALIRQIVKAGVSKYNPGAGEVLDLPKGRCILVPGQVEDDASILKGTGAVATNIALLKAARAANPDAILLYKPHPDVEAGLRKGVVPEEEVLRVADQIVRGDPVALIASVDAVWTMTSALGFEALLRKVPVTCLGVPFYAGWGLTEDRMDVPARRGVPVRLTGLVHAALIGYPRYFDPVTGAPCPVEIAVERLSSGAVARPGAGLRALSKVQGMLASYAHLWR
ncbi:MAG: capsular polysaccharide biosynthesis protein [Pseudomonadota bacterium]